MKAVIPAAGNGTRLSPATKVLPKEMFPLIDTPAIHMVVEEALSAGFDEVIVVISGVTSIIKPYLRKAFEDDKRGKIRFLVQDEPYGLGGAVLSASKAVNGEPFALLLPDEIFLGDTVAITQLIEAHYVKGASVIGASFVEEDEVSRYGMIILEPGLNRVAAFEEKPTATTSRQAMSGRYILTPGIFICLQKMKNNNHGGEISLTDALNLLLEDESIEMIELEGNRFDVGNKLGYLMANIEMGLRRPDLNGALKQYLMEVRERLIARGDEHA
ncbi:MAG: NTP transferase domain-containing protein [Candidatus Thermoplasmatota archaeon]|nr:UTP--glucose-1-phosphate uridylyltransferase [Euryarchaeota archaeon]MBU4144033.1 NTP transferase domain-containing protein [Candidatus Thermoplasmatota archaeon]MBU4591853.1 NTP transferase domain-containing protein [Candidatus Thermoplasmatota archaeon]